MLVSTYSLLGLTATRVHIAVTPNLEPRAPKISLLGDGLSDQAQRELRTKVSYALLSVGLEPRPEVTVVFDQPLPTGEDPTLALALAICLPDGVRSDTAVFGTLNLAGEARAIPGAVVRTLAAKADGSKRVLVPERNAGECSLVPGIEVIPVRSLSHAVAILNGTEKPVAVTPTRRDLPLCPDLSEIKGQEHAKRALEIAAAGRHNILFVGPPGSGKTMLARRFNSLLSPMTESETLEAASIYSTAGLLSNDSSYGLPRPFRAPHHTVSDLAMTGGGSGVPRPGEMALAHNGVLFLDELSEFSKPVLEHVRHSVKTGTVEVHSAKYGQITYPANFVLVGSVNPCPCGHLGDPRRVCTCTVPQIERHVNRTKAFIEEVFDLVVEVPAVSAETLRDSKILPEKSESVRERVTKAQAYPSNVMELGVSETAFLERVVEKLSFSPEQYVQTVKVARTIANLAGEPRIRVEHLAEAVQYRMRRG